MIRGIVESSIRYRFLVVTLALLLALFGANQMRAIPVDTLPEFAPPYVEVQTEALGLSAAEVEMLISLPLESLLNGTPWLQTIRSQSVPGLSSLMLIFEPGTDVLRARQLVEERLGAAAGAMPNVSKPPVILQPLSATSRVMMIGLSSKEISEIEMSVLTRWNIRPALMGVPGVANVSVWGMRERQLQVQVDPQLLKEKGVTLQQVISTTGNALWYSPLSYLTASTSGTGGWIDTPNQRLGIRHLLPISTPEELAEVMVTGSDYELGEVATVVENHQPLIGDSLQQEPSGIILVVEKFPGSNALEVIRGVENRLNALRPGLTGIQIDSNLFRTSNYLDLAIDNLSRTLLIGMVLLIAALFLLMQNWRAAVVSLLILPLTLMVALYILYLRGSTMNTMVFAGLLVALAVLIDDMVVDIENILYRRQTERLEGGAPNLARFVESFSEIRSPLLYAAAILLMIAAPIFLLQGVYAAIFRPLVIAYMVAVAASALVAIVVTPALAWILFTLFPSRPRENRLSEWAGTRYEKAITRAVQSRNPVFITTGVVIVATLAALPFIGRDSLLPTYVEPHVLIHWDAAPGTSHPEMVRLTDKARQELLQVPGVRSVSVNIGRAVLSDQVSDINAAELWVNLDPAANHEATVAAVQSTVEGYPGVFHQVRSYMQESLSQALTGSNKEVVVRLYGPELEELNTQAAQVRDAISGIEGVVDLEMESQVIMPEVQIELDLEKAKAYGIKPGDVRRSAATLLAGLEVGSLFEEQKVFEVVVWGMPESRHSVDGVRSLLIDTPQGGHVRLSDIANVTVASAPNRIEREATSRKVDVGFNVSGRDIRSVVLDVQSRLNNISFPLEYHPEILGEYAGRQQATTTFLVAVAVAIIGIYLILQAAFNSWRLALLALLGLPLSLAGGVLAAAFSPDHAINLGVILGFLAVIGIATRSSILLITRYQRLEAEGQAFGPALIICGARKQAIPTMMTAITTALVLLPMVIFGKVAGHEIAYPMALVILGGLVTETLLNLFIMPALYLFFGKARQPVPQKPPVQSPDAGMQNLPA